MVNELAVTNLLRTAQKFDLKLHNKDRMNNNLNLSITIFYMKINY